MVFLNLPEVATLNDLKEAVATINIETSDRRQYTATYNAAADGRDLRLEGSKSVAEAADYHSTAADHPYNVWGHSEQADSRIRVGAN